MEPFGFVGPELRPGYEQASLCGPDGPLVSLLAVPHPLKGGHQEAAVELVIGLVQGDSGESRGPGYGHLGKLLDLLLEKRTRKMIRDQMNQVIKQN